jgi:hypothetical protein
MDRGILIFATEHPYYGRCAYNLAATIKASNKNMPVAVVHSGNGLSHLSDVSLFDYIIDADKHEAGVSIKLWSDVYTPFEETLVIDADNLWFNGNDPLKAFAPLDDYYFTAITEGMYDFSNGDNDLNKNYYVWSDIDALQKAFNLKGIMYQFRSEVMLFSVTDMFAKAREIYANPKVDVTLFGGHIPDEFAINVACCLLEIEPHEYKWQPSYWDRMHLADRALNEKRLAEKYLILSTGGNRVSEQCRKMYDRIASAACYKMGREFMFTLLPKRRMINERKIF